MYKAERRRLPNDRSGHTHKFEIRGKNEVSGEIETIDGYLTVNHYEDGRPGEIFVRLSKMGTQVAGFADAWAIAVSMLLQTGTPIETVCSKFRGVSFDPAGQTNNKAIPFARSPIDYIARWLEIQYVDNALAADEPSGVASTAPHGAETTCQKYGCTETKGLTLRRGRMICAHHATGRA